MEKVEKGFLFVWALAEVEKVEKDFLFVWDSELMRGHGIILFPRTHPP